MLPDKGEECIIGGGGDGGPDDPHISAIPTPQPDKPLPPKPGGVTPPPCPFEVVSNISSVQGEGFTVYSSSPFNYFDYELRLDVDEIDEETNQP